MPSHSLEFLQAAFDALPNPVFVVDDDVRIEALNQAAHPLMGNHAFTAYRQRGGEALRCVHRHDHPDGCGRGSHCRICVIRKSVGSAFNGQRVVRTPATLEIDGPEGPREIHVLVTTAPLSYGDRRMVLLTLEEINELVELRRLIPICAWCKKVRNEEQFWDNVETYVQKHLDVDFSHGICPECLAEKYPGVHPVAESLASGGANP